MQHYFIFLIERFHFFQVDTGGPILFLDEEVNRIKVIGILFTLKNVCEGYFQTRVTKIIHFLDWIIEKTRKETENNVKTTAYYLFFFS